MEEEYLSSSRNYLVIDHRENPFMKCLRKLRVSQVQAVDEGPANLYEIVNKKVDKIYQYLSKEYDENKDSEEIFNKLDDLILKGCDVNYQNDNGENVLHLIASLKPKQKTIELYEYFIRKNCDLKTNKKGYSFIHTAAYYNNDLLIEHILRNNPGLLKISEGKSTLLHLAAKAGAIDTVKLLFKNGVNKESKDHLGRTPLYLAAEHQQDEVVKFLLEQGCDVQAKNINGQKALYWIVAKCPQFSVEIFDKYRKLDKYAYKDIYYLKNLEREPVTIFVEQETTDGKSRINSKYPYVKSILEYLIEQQNLELITHPVVKRLINFKFRQNLWWFWGKFVVDFLFCVIWNVWTVLISYEKRFLYNFPGDWWRIFLFIFLIIGLIVMITVEIVEEVSKVFFKKKIQNKRQSEIDSDRNQAFPLDQKQKDFFKNEDKLSKKSTGFSDSYLADNWNILDLVTIIFLFASLGTHLADIINHGETIARNHIRVTSITVLFISARVLKSARILWEPLGMLVMTLYFIVWDIFVWTLVFLLTWIPFTTCFFILFGNGQTISKENDSCSLCSFENQTILDGMESYPKAMFFLFKTTFGVGEIDFEGYNQKDSEMADFIFGLYIGLTTLILLNIFVALLTSTFERVQSFSKGLFLIERAKEILTFEYTLCENTRIRLLSKIPNENIKKYKPSEYNNEISLKTLLDPISESVRDLNVKYELLSKYCDDSKSQFNPNFEILQTQINEIKTILIDMNQRKHKEKNKKENPKVDVLYLSNIESLVNTE